MPRSVSLYPRRGRKSKYKPALQLKRSWTASGAMPNIPANQVPATSYGEISSFAGSLRSPSVRWSEHLARRLLRQRRRYEFSAVRQSNWQVEMRTPNGLIGHLLVVEPEALLRWSLATYLSKWFDVHPTDSPEAALRILDDYRVDGAVISDQLAPGSAPAIAARLGLRNPSATIVYTVTSAETSVAEDRVSLQIEKPFQLADLAALLGVEVRDDPGDSAPGGDFE